MKEVGEVRREKEGKVFSKKCPGLRACPHLSLPEEVMVRDSRTGGCLDWEGAAGYPEEPRMPDADPGGPDSLGSLRIRAAESCV